MLGTYIIVFNFKLLVNNNNNLNYVKFDDNQLKTKEYSFSEHFMCQHSK